MTHKYSMTRARHNLSGLIRDLERKGHIELTRHGKPVAVMLSILANRHLQARRSNFWGANQALRGSHSLADLDIHPEIFQGVRDSTTGREVHR
jgi:prevent-host-death family protein